MDFHFPVGRLLLVILANPRDVKSDLKVELGNFPLLHFLENPFLANCVTGQPKFYNRELRTLHEGQ